jgi:hypothetical protein
MSNSTLIKTASVVLFLSISACASNDVADRIEAVQEAQQIARETQAEQAQDQREEEMDASPDWFLSPPLADGTGFFGVGYAKSKHMGHALKSAKLQAEFDLAKVYKQELSGSERAFERGNSDGDVQVQTTFLIDKIIDAVPIIGYQVIEQKMIPINGVYETFVLLKLPYDQFNEVLQSQRQNSLDKTVQASFDDLDRRLAQRRTQKTEMEEAVHKREMETMQQRADILNASEAAAQKAKSENTDQSGITSKSESRS